MFTLTETRTFSIGAEAFVSRTYVNAPNASTVKPSVPAALAAILSTRSSDTAGVATLTAAAPAPPAVGALVDIYFEGGALVNAEVVAVAGADVTFTSDVGDLLPAEGAAVSLAVPLVAALAFDGTAALGYAVKGGGAAGRVSFLDVLDPAAVEWSPVELAPGEGRAWSSAGEDPNPLAGVAVAGVRFTHGDTLKPRTMSATVLLPETAPAARRRRLEG